MTQAIEAQRDNHHIVDADTANAWTPQRVDLLKRTTMNSHATDDEMALFVQVCKRTGLDPFARQIYAIHRKNHKTGEFEMSIQTSIDGFRVIASRNPQYAGQTAPEWCATDGKWRSIWTSSEPPAAARIGVYRTNFREPTYAVAHYNEYFQKNNFLWKSMPANMLAKCAESLALRKAFPAELSGLYTSEEMHQADNAVVLPEQPNPNFKQIDQNKYPPRRTSAVEVVEVEHHEIPAEMQTASSMSNDEKMISTNQHGLIRVLFKEIPGSPQDGEEMQSALNDWTAKMFDGKRLSELTMAEASRFINRIKEVKDKRLAQGDHGDEPDHSSSGSTSLNPTIGIYEAKNLREAWHAKFGNDRDLNEYVQHQYQVNSINHLTLDAASDLADYLSQQ